MRFEVPTAVLMIQCCIHWCIGITILEELGLHLQCSMEAASSSETLVPVLQYINLHCDVSQMSTISRLIVVSKIKWENCDLV